MKAIGLILLMAVAFLTACGSSTASENESYSSEIATSAEEEEGAAKQAEEASEDSPGESAEEYEEEVQMAEDRINELFYETPDGETGYLYIPDSVQSNPETKVPMVLMMMCTGGEARQNAIDCGWVDKAQAEGIIVMAPVYNNYATYSELPGILPELFAQ